jgi:hypothetical protein
VNSGMPSAISIRTAPSIGRLFGKLLNFGKDGIGMTKLVKLPRS